MKIPSAFAAALLFAAASLFVSVPLRAQAGPCSAGSSSTFTVFIGPPVTIHHESTQAIVNSQVSVNGSEITVTQWLNQNVPMFPAPSLPPPCYSADVSLGSLPPGIYDVTWIEVQSSDPPAYRPTHLFSFAMPSTIPALDPRALAALFVVLAIAGAVMLRG